MRHTTRALTFALLILGIALPAAALAADTITHDLGSMPAKPDPARKARMQQSCEQLRKDHERLDGAKTTGAGLVTLNAGGKYLCRVSFKTSEDHERALWKYRHWKPGAPGMAILEYTDTDAKHFERSDNAKWVPCAGHCYKTQGKCGAMVFRTSGSGVCWYKQSADATKTFYHPQRRTAIRLDTRTWTRFDALRDTTKKGVDRKGNDLRTINNASQDSCRVACAADGRCKAFSYHWNERKCWLKSAEGSPTSAPANVSSGTVSRGSGGGRA